jgi:hypothetical protein
MRYSDEVLIAFLITLSSAFSDSIVLPTVWLSI